MDEAEDATRRWMWEQDDKQVNRLLSMMPVPKLANTIGIICMSRQGSKRLPLLLLKYAQFMDGDVARSMHQCVQDGLRYDPKPHWCYIAGYLDDNICTTQACICALSCASEPTVKAAAHVLATSVAATADDLMVVFDTLCHLAATSKDAVFLITRVADGCGYNLAPDEVRCAVQVLVKRGKCSTTYLALRSLAFHFPSIVAEENGLLVALMLGNTLTKVEHKCPAIPQTESELLIYLRVHGTWPQNPDVNNLVASVFQNPSKDVRAAYADQIQEWPEYTVPENEPFDEQYCGCITFKPSGVKILHSLLARASSYFRSPHLSQSSVEVNYDTKIVEEFRQLVYYDTPPEQQYAVQVAKLADMLCATRPVHIAIDTLVCNAAFWLAYDTAKDWPYVQPLLRMRAMQSADVLMRHQRAAEIATLIAGL